MSKTIGKVYVDAVITDEQYKECMRLVREANERIDELLAENAELRELVASVWRLFAEHGAVNPCDLPEVDAVRDRMRELGVEVDA